MIFGIFLGVWLLIGFLYGLSWSIKDWFNGRGLNTNHFTACLVLTIFGPAGFIIIIPNRYIGIKSGPIKIKGRASARALRILTADPT